MMRFDWNANGIYLSFSVTEEGFLRLLHCTNQANPAPLSEKQIAFAPAVEIQCSGANQNDHHGAKQTCCGSWESLRYETHEQTADHLKITLSDDSLRVRLYYQSYPGVCGVRTWTEIENIGSEVVGLEYVSSFALTGIGSDSARILIPTNAWRREVDWKEYTLGELGLERDTDFATKRIAVSNTGTWSAKEFLPMGCLADEECAYLWQIEHNGSWCWEIGDLVDTLYLRLSGPSERENHWYRALKPQECFESVPSVLCIGKNFEAALAEMTAYRRQIIRNSPTDQAMPVIFNDYMNCLWADPTEEKMLPVIRRAAEAGAEYYCMDAGWYADGTWWKTVGEWEPCEWRFPHGIKAVFDEIRRFGMIPGIWLEIEVMGIQCPLAKTLPDDWFFLRHGKRVIDHGRYQLDFRNEAVRAYADRIIDRVVGEYGVGYIKLDYNIDAGIGTEHEADSFGDGLLAHNRAYLVWLKSVILRYPDLILENCASGGMRMDYASLSVSAVQSVSDCDTADGMAYLAAAAPTAVLPEQAAIWSYPKKEDSLSAVITNLVSPMMERIHLSGEIFALSEEAFSLVQEGVLCYKKTRADIPHAIPVYPLGLPAYTDSLLVSGFRTKERLYLKVWRRSGAEETVQIPSEGAAFVQPLFGDPACKLSLEDGIITVHLPQENSAVFFSAEFSEQR